MNKRIVIMAGGTGGHVFPALAVAQALREQGWQVSWLGTEKGLEKRVSAENGFELDYLSVAGIRGKGLLFKFKSVLLLLKACLQARRVLKRRKPQVVLGMGGFVAGPGGLMAKWLGIPLVIHEQNRVVGTTNRLLARFANRVLEAFPNSFKPKAKAVCTGNPLRKAFVEAVSLVEQKRDEQLGLKLLVIGGSQGAKILNEIVPEAVAVLPKSVTIQVKHQTGAVMRDEVAAHYEKLNIEAQVLAFVEDMVAVYAWADLIVCRAGAMTVSEVAAMGLPSIFIPLPTAIDDHQTANARYLTDTGAAYMLKQQDLSPISLAQLIEQVMIKKEQMRVAALQSARLQATNEVAAICVAEAGA
jgi:UDP-N-acetylglucosamine--N-acetylmuramyl-(pentapeptide) pyrophosphoryl-undecaprenol N-acetylglucosamine transferase